MDQEKKEQLVVALHASFERVLDLPPALMGIVVGNQKGNTFDIEAGLEELAQHELTLEDMVALFSLTAAIAAQACAARAGTGEEGTRVLLKYWNNLIDQYLGAMEESWTKASSQTDCSKN